MPRLALLFLLSGCAMHERPDLRVPERRILQQAVRHGDTATAARAVGGIVVLGPAALDVLPSLLARDDLDRLDPRLLADAVEALGPGAVPALEAALAMGPKWAPAGLDGLARIGPAGVDALLRLTTVPAVSAPAWEALRAVSNWRANLWVEPGVRQRNPYLLSDTWFTPFDDAQVPALQAAACAVIPHGAQPALGYATTVLTTLGPATCLAPLLASSYADVRWRAMNALPTTGPRAAATAHVLLDVLAVGTVLTPSEHDTYAAYILGAAAADPGLLDGALALLASEDLSTRRAIATALSSQAGAATVVAAVMARLPVEPDVLTRDTLVRVIGRSQARDPAVWARLLDQGVDDSLPGGPNRPSVADAVIAALGTLASHDWLRGEARRLDAPLSRRCVAAFALGSWREPEDIAVLLRALRDGTTATRGRAARTLAEDPTVDPAIGPALRAASRDDRDGAVRLAVLLGLEELARDAPEDNLPVIHAALVGDAAGYVRAGAARALVQLYRRGVQPRRVAAWLDAARADPDVGVREAVAEFLVNRSGGTTAR